LNITSLLLVVLFDYTTRLISYTHNGDDTHKDLRKACREGVAVSHKQVRIWFLCHNPLQYTVALGLL